MEEDNVMELDQMTIDTFENDNITQCIQSALSGISSRSSSPTLSLFHLPDSVLLKIFSNLSQRELCRVALVCKHWLWIVFDSELWRQVDFSKCTNITEEHIVNLIRRRLSPLLRLVDLSNCPVTPVLFHEIKDNFQQLETLVLKNSNFKHDRENNNRDDNKDSNDEDNAYCNNKVGNAMKPVSVPDNLIRLDIRNLKSGFQFVHLILEGQGMRQLECFGFGEDSICPFDFRTLLGSMRHLRILECVDCDSITDPLIALAAGQLKNLESLALKKCKSITGSTLDDLIKSAHNLKSLNLSGTKVNDDSLSITAWELSRIEELDMSFCDSVTHIGLSNSIWKIKTLQYLVLNNTGRGRAVRAELFYKSVAQASWKNLHSVCLHFCNRLQGDQLFGALKNSIHLKRISLRTCHKITFDEIAKNLRHFPNIIFLECGSLFPLDKTSSRWRELLESISTHCLQLKYLIILKCEPIPPTRTSLYWETMHRFVGKCTKLNAIAVLYSEQAIVNLFQRCVSKVKRNPPIEVSSTKTLATMPPFRHSLDSEINRQKFQNFFGY